MHHLRMLIKLISHMSNPKSLLESAHVELACLIKPMVRVDDHCQDFPKVLK